MFNNSFYQLKFDNGQKPGETSKSNTSNKNMQAYLKSFQDFGNTMREIQVREYLDERNRSE